MYVLEPDGVMSRHSIGGDALPEISSTLPLSVVILGRLSSESDDEEVAYSP